MLLDPGNENDKISIPITLPIMIHAGMSAPCMGISTLLLTHLS